MTGFGALIVKDLRLALARPAVFAFIALFAISAGALTFYPGRFFDAGRADLSTLFAFFPWLFVLFTPALAMDALSAERRTGTAEILFSLPLRPGRIVLSKWLSLWIICLVGLALTMSLWLSISVLGTPDHGAIVAGYVGAALLAGSSCALSLAASARTSSQVTAFLGAITLNTLVTIGALPVLSFLPELAARAMEDFSIPVHLTHFTRGVLSLTDIAFFIALTGFGLYVASVLWRSARWAWCRIILVGLALLAVNTGFTTDFLRATRLDLTAGHLYTLSPAARAMIENKTTPTNWRFYYSRALASYYPDIRSYGARVEESLQGFAEASKGKIRLGVVDPGVDNRREDKAMAMGMEPLPTDRGEPLYFGLADDTGALISRFDPARASVLEYDLARSLGKRSGARPRLALYDGIDLAGRDWFVTGRKESFIYGRLAEQYEIELLDQDFGPNDLEGRILMLVHPPAFDQQQDQAISDFIASGGRALVFLDPYSEASARPALNGFAKPGARMASTAPGFLVPAGLGWSSTRLVLDRDTAMPIERRQNGQTRNLRQSAWMGVPAKQYSKDSPVTSFLQRGLVLASAGRFTSSANENWKPLIISSTNAALLAASIFATDPDPAELMVSPPSTGEPYWLGVVKNGVIVLGDADMLDDDFYVQDDPVFGARAQTDNASFVLNALDWLSGSDALLDLRSRAAAPRRLSKIDTMRKNARQKLETMQVELGRSSDEAAQRALRTVRQKFHRRISTVETMLEGINIALVPFLFILLGGALGLWRRRHRALP